MIEKLLDLLEIELVDDVPLLLAQLQRMQVDKLLDQRFPTHGNWAGELTFGEVVIVWLAFVISQADHRLCRVETWAAERLLLLSACLSKPVRALDLSDDRLASILDLLGDPEKWAPFERELNQSLLRVYELRAQTARVDPTTVASYGEADGKGLLQFGHGKNGRADLMQLKVSLSTLDPLGLPLVAQVVGGASADDPLFLPQIKQVQASLGRGGKLYVGDSKMGATQTRAYIASSGDYYLCPMSQAQLQATPLAQLLEPVWSGRQALQPMVDPRSDELIGLGFEYAVELSCEVEGQPVNWLERRLVTRSLAWAEQQVEGLARRLSNASTALERLNERKRGRKRLSEAEMISACEKIVEQTATSEIMRWEVRTVESEVASSSALRKKSRTEVEVQVRSEIDPEALARAQQMMGWRVYATNQPQSERRLNQVVAAYREQYQIERGIGRLKGQPLGLEPLYISDETRLRGLVHLLTIALRLLSLTEFVARRALKQESRVEDRKLRGLYAYQPGRATESPTSETMLEAFSGLKLKTIEVEGKRYAKMTPLNAVQARILRQLGFSSEIYDRLPHHLLELGFYLSEP
jgi:transposase